MPAWCVSFPIDGRVVLVQLLPLREFDGRPRWSVEWSEVPPRLPPDLIAEFDARLKLAQAAILERMAKTLEAST